MNKLFTEMYILYKNEKRILKLNGQDYILLWLVYIFPVFQVPITSVPI